MKTALKYFGVFIVLTILLPISVGAALGFARGWPESWRAASWASSGLLPQAGHSQPATVMILSTRTGRWKSIFAEHMSIVMKPKGALTWTRYDVVGWGTPVRKNAYAADALWYGNTPRIVYRLDGEAAETLIPKIATAVQRYPHQQRGSYTVWPGPNSNTFVAWVVRNTIGFDTELPPVAVGKDWLGTGFASAVAPSKTGWTYSFMGVIGATLAREEGLELHVLGSTIGVDFNDLAIKLPALDKLSLM
jgi:Protein of unknown function (DUF3750)